MKVDRHPCAVRRSRATLKNPRAIRLPTNSPVCTTPEAPAKPAVPACAQSREFVFSPASRAQKCTSPLPAPTPNPHKPSPLSKIGFDSQNYRWISPRSAVGNQPAGRSTVHRSPDPKPAEQKIQAGRLERLAEQEQLQPLKLGNFGGAEALLQGLRRLVKWMDTNGLYCPLQLNSWDGPWRPEGHSYSLSARHGRRILPKTVILSSDFWCLAKDKFRDSPACPSLRDAAGDAW